MQFFSTNIRKNTQVSNLMEVRVVRAEFVPCGLTDGQTDITKLLVTFQILGMPLKTLRQWEATVWARGPNQKNKISAGLTTNDTYFLHVYKK